MKKISLAMVAWLVFLGAADGTLAAPPGAIPVYCSATALESEERVLTCRRSDTRVVVTPVADNLFLHISDIVVSPNNIATNGIYVLIVGRDDAGAYPNLPNVRLLGDAAGSYNFSTPYLVFRNGEDISARLDSNSVLSAVDVRASGYLANQASP